MRLIINADDLGISPEGNDAIFDLMAQGRVTSATILANGSAVKDAATRLRAFSKISFGVHLNATEFKPLTSNPDLAPILKADGTFAANIRNVPIGRKLCEALWSEWCAQVEALRTIGVPLSHIDSHHHVHTIPALFLVLKRVQRRFHLRKVRISANIYTSRDRPSNTLLFKKALWNTALRQFYRTRTTAGLTSFDSFCERASIEPMPHSTVELMAHPGNVGWSAETERLRNAWQQTLPFATKLISYNEL
jgi:chitin disaccharide deacetylase